MEVLGGVTQTATQEEDLQGGSQSTQQSTGQCVCAKKGTEAGGRTVRKTYGEQCLGAYKGLEFTAVPTSQTGKPDNSWSIRCHTQNGFASLD